MKLIIERLSQNTEELKTIYIETKLNSQVIVRFLNKTGTTVGIGDVLHYCNNMLLVENDYSTTIIDRDQYLEYKQVILEIGEFHDKKLGDHI